MNATIEATVMNLFRALEARAIRYAVLRNYECFPALRLPDRSSPHTDIDLVVDSRDLEAFRGLLTGIAEQDGWDSLIECDHWSQSKVRHHNIEVFRFSRSGPLEFLQVDVFHGVLVWGLPAADERRMLEGRIYDSGRRLTRIDPVTENIHRMLQIHGLYPGSDRKRARYREKLIAFRADHRKAFDEGIRSTLTQFGVRAADALERGDTAGFLYNMRLARGLFVLRFSLRHAISALSFFSSRLRENIQRYFTRQCGVALRTAVRNERQRQMVRGILDELVRSSYMDNWSEHEEGERLSLSDHVAMEQGALIIRWVSSGPIDLDFRKMAGRTAMAEAILAIGTKRHRQLYSCPAAQESNSREEALAR